MTKTQAGLLTVLVIQFLVVEGGISSPTPSLDAVGQRESTEFTFARVQFNSYGRWGRTPGWAHDYPRAERNFLTILSDVTGIQTSPESYVIVQLDDPEIMKYPILYFSEPGSWNITSEEAENFREYVRRGGFAIFDDFDGRRDWLNFYSCIKRVFPERDLELLTLENPIFHCFYDIETLDMIPPMRYREDPLFYGMWDEGGRIQIVVNFNNDLGDFWEWSDESIFPIHLSNEAYKFGVNYIIYAMSH
ncbi:DUF4159 domain-containing protein [Acidobacteria bacterium AH-259-O06]|nr:DUF4159 domain-containing protein [Acidobacteria bacterium AH-259-O06]